ncbi:MAG: hypothetical protein QOG60_811, partial [Frankiaceae bacterium]|nr:hypothetical protein [Frankiaceae bacterium]
MRVNPSVTLARNVRYPCWTGTRRTETAVTAHFSAVPERAIPDLGAYDIGVIGAGRVGSVLGA